MLGVLHSKDKLEFALLKIEYSTISTDYYYDYVLEQQQKETHHHSSSLSRISRSSILSCAHSLPLLDIGSRESLDFLFPRRGYSIFTHQFGVDHFLILTDYFTRAFLVVKRRIHGVEQEIIP